MNDKDSHSSISQKQFTQNKVNNLNFTQSQKNKQPFPIKTLQDPNKNKLFQSIYPNQEMINILNQNNKTHSPSHLFRESYQYSNPRGIQINIGKNNFEKTPKSKNILNKSCIKSEQINQRRAQTKLLLQTTPGLSRHFEPHTSSFQQQKIKYLKKRLIRKIQNAIDQNFDASKILFLSEMKLKIKICKTTNKRIENVKKCNYETHLEDQIYKKIFLGEQLHMNRQYLIKEFCKQTLKYKHTYEKLLQVRNKSKVRNSLFKIQEKDPLNNPK